MLSYPGRNFKWRFRFIWFTFWHWKTSQKGKWRFRVRWFTLNLPLQQMLMAFIFFTAISVYPLYPHLAVQLPCRPAVLLEGQHTAASAAHQIGALWGSPGHPPRMARAARWQMESPESSGRLRSTHRWNKQKPEMCLGFPGLTDHKYP